MESSNELREVLDKFVKIACSPEIHQSENEFINLVDEFISSFILHSDISECIELRDQLDGLCAKYNTHDESLVLRYIRHLDENTKFAKQKTKWQNFKKKAEGFIAGGLSYSINDLNIRNPAGFVERR